MTGPNPDAELDQALGITHLPPAAITENHRDLAMRQIARIRQHLDDEPVTVLAQVIADAEQRGAARALTEHTTAGTPTTNGTP